MTTRSTFRSGVLTFLDSVTHARVLPLAPYMFYNDFGSAGFQTLPAAGSAVQGDPFVKKIVGAAPPTVAGVANALAGQVAITLTATSEKQDAVLYWDDNLGLDVTKGLLFEARVRLSVLPSAAGVQAVWGVAGAWIDGPDNNLDYLQFGATANGAVVGRSQDGTTQASIASGTTLLTADWHIYRIAATPLTDIRYYIAGVQLSANNAVSFAATGTSAVLQPYLAMYKPSGTGVGTMLVDYVRAWQNRS